MTANRLGKTLANASLGFMLVACCVVLSSTNAQAQTPSSICRQNGLLENREDLNGAWQLSFSIGATRYITKLVIKGDAGISETQYYASNLGRKRRIGQVHVLCQATVGVVILGYRPTDLDTNQSGSSVKYNADNFVIAREPDGTVVAFNRDDAGTLAKIHIEFIRELDQ